MLASLSLPKCTEHLYDAVLVCRSSKWCPISLPPHPFVRSGVRRVHPRYLDEVGPSPPLSPVVRCRDENARGQLFNTEPELTEQMR